MLIDVPRSPILPRIDMVQVLMAQTSFMQMAVQRHAQLCQAADQLQWSQGQRRRHFKGPHGAPRVFILAPYRKQAVLCRALLASHPTLSLADLACYEVCSTSVVLFPQIVQRKPVM